MAIKEAKYIWRDGEMIPWKDATIHALSHVVHYGSCVFEGIRAYATENGPAFFRLDEHLQRMLDSARIYRMDVPYSSAELRAACHDVIAANDLEGAYVRPFAFHGYNSLGVLPAPGPVKVMVAAFEWGAYLGDEGLSKGVDVGVSSWQRPAPNTFPTMAKAACNYMPGQLMVGEARRHGYVEGIALDSRGYLSEGPGENLFIIRNGVIYTPSMESALLVGITRDSVIQLARHLGYEVREQVLPREMLYVADELFFTGTAAEVTPIRSVDGLQVGAGHRGPITEAIQNAFFDLVQGRSDAFSEWLQIVETRDMTVGV